MVCRHIVYHKFGETILNLFVEIVLFVQWLFQFIFISRHAMFELLNQSGFQLDL